MLQKIRYFIPFAVIITCTCALVYGTVQQNFRQSANDPQIQISEDLASGAAQTANPAQINLGAPIDISASLATFVIIYDKDGKEIAGNAKIAGQTPQIPGGVLEYAKAHGQDRITWQPQPNTRAAIVVTYYKGQNEGYVLVGKSLREVEKRELKLQYQVLAVWLVTMAASFVTTVIFIPELTKASRKKS